MIQVYWTFFCRRFFKIFECLKCYSYNPNKKPDFARFQFDDAQRTSQPVSAHVEEQSQPWRRSGLQRMPSLIVSEEQPITHQRRLTDSNDDSTRSSSDSRSQNEPKRSGPLGIHWAFWIGGAILIVLIVIGIALGLYFGLRKKSSTTAPLRPKRMHYFIFWQTFFIAFINF